MKKKLFSLIMIFSLLLTGCVDTETTSSNQDGQKKTVFTIAETAKVNDTEIKINSVKKILKECNLEWDGKCESYNEPDNDYFLVLDITITNLGDEELSISSMMSFDLKDKNGEKGSIEILLDAVQSSLDESVMSGDKLKGQIAYDVKESDEYYFYYQDSLLDDTIKFVINQSDIQN